MSAYPPTNQDHIPAADYELPEIPTSSSTPGPSKPRRHSSRTITLHPNQSTSALFPSGIHSPRRHIPHLSPDIPTTSHHRSQFLFDDGEGTRDMEEVDVPDFGHMWGFNPDDVDHLAVAGGMRVWWKKRLYLLMEEPASGREAFFVHIIVTGAILFSAVLTTLSTLPSFHTDPASTRILFGLDTTLVVLFTIEYLARSLAHSDSWTQYYKWSTSFFALIDLIAILPYYIEVARNDDTSILFRFSILRIFRLLRVFRAFKYQNQMLLTIEVMYVAVNRSKDALVALAFFILLVLVLFSTLIYFAERGTWDATLGGFVDADGDPSLFDSIPQTAWFALVTMSTVGYGDVVPRSMLGKVLTVPLLMFGLLLIALPSFVLGRNFAIVFDAMTSRAQKPPSASSSPRQSEELPPSLTINSRAYPPPMSLSTSFNPNPLEAPLLPISTDTLSLPLNQLTKTASRSITPLPQNTPAARQQPQPRMWDGIEPVATNQRDNRDLTNVKLAKNQLVLLEQIDDLRRVIDRQGEVLERLMGMLERDREGREKGRPVLETSARKHAGLAGGARGEKGEKDEEHFTLGSDDDTGIT